MSLFLSNKYGNSLVPCALPKQSFHPPPSDLNLSADNAGGKPILTHSKNSASIKCLLFIESSLIRPTRIGTINPWAHIHRCPLAHWINMSEINQEQQKKGAVWTTCFEFSRNYHVFYYLLLGASEEDRKEFKLLPPEEFSYLKQVQDSLPDSFFSADVSSNASAH